jgi:hypothetical protein
VNPVMTRTAVIIKDKSQQYEGLRTSLGLLLYGARVQMFVLNHEIETMDEVYRDNMEFIDEMEGERFSNNSVNVERYGFKYLTLTEIAAKIDRAEVVIPF